VSANLDDFRFTHWLGLLFRSFIIDVEIGHRIGSKKFYSEAVVFSGLFYRTVVGIFFDFMYAQVGKTLMLPPNQSPEPTAAATAVGVSYQIKRRGENEHQ
jgi:hypothetical protein